MRVLIITAVIFILSFAQVSAQEIFCYTENRGGKTTDYYVLPDSLQKTNYGFKVTLHSIGINYSYNKFWEMGFTYQNGDLYAIWLPSTATTRVTDVNSDRVLNDHCWKIFVAVAKNR